MKGEITVEFSIYVSLILIVYVLLFAYYTGEKNIFSNKDPECEYIVNYLIDTVNSGYIYNYYRLDVVLPDHDCNISTSGGRIGCVSQTCEYFREGMIPIRINGTLAESTRLQITYDGDTAIIGVLR